VGSYTRQGFVEVLAAQQSPENPDWFQGTADAVRQYLWLFKARDLQAIALRLPAPPPACLPACRGAAGALRVSRGSRLRSRAVSAPCLDCAAAANAGAGAPAGHMPDISPRRGTRLAFASPLPRNRTTPSRSI
jgi:hypothetical protein